MPPTALKKSNLASFFGIKEFEKSASKYAKGEVSFVSIVIDIPQDNDLGHEVDYEVSIEAYKNY